MINDEACKVCGRKILKGSPGVTDPAKRLGLPFYHTFCAPKKLLDKVQVKRHKRRKKCVCK